MKTLFALTVLLCLVACSSDDDDEPSFGVGEMKGAIEGTWTGTITINDVSTEATLKLTYQSPGAQTACGNRVLSSDEKTKFYPGVALNCIDSTQMNVTGIFSTADKTYNAVAVEGDYTAYGNSADSGDLQLSSKEGSLYLHRDNSGVLDGTLQVSSDESHDLSLHR